MFCERWTAHLALTMACVCVAGSAHRDLWAGTADATTLDSIDALGQWSVIPLARFNPMRSDNTYTVATDGSTAYHSRQSANNGGFHAAFDLPASSQVHEVCVFAYDNTASTELAMVVVFTELGDATRPAVGGTAPGTAAFTGVASTPGYVRLCSLPTNLYLNNFGDPSGDGVSGWLTWSLQVFPGMATGTWPQVGWGGAAVRWSNPPFGSGAEDRP